MTPPQWLRIAAAFLCGALVSGVALVRYVPEGDHLAGDPTTFLEIIDGGDGGLPDDLVADTLEEYVDEEGRTVRRIAGDGSGTSGEGIANDPTQPGNVPGAGPEGQNSLGVGVEPNRIRLASTVVQDGPAKSLLEDAEKAMRAVINRVNRDGGIHGRRLDLTTNNDSFNAQAGQQIIKNYIEQGFFALPVVPSAEGLGQAITAGDIRNAGIPVVGTDGMRQEQYSDPWVWPVATATVSTMRIMAEYGYTKMGARTFAIVYDSKYRFGGEGKDAFVAQVKRMAGAAVLHEQALDPDVTSYDAARFNQACSEGCDMVAFLLLPETAKRWLQAQPSLGTKYTSGAQTLFSDAFGQDCVEVMGNRCAGLEVWTGYNPPIDSLRTDPDIARYIQEVRQVGADETNQFVQGAYLGMSVFVEALRRAGPNLTRARLQEVMNSMDYSSGLSPNLRWRSNDKWANTQARSFGIVTGTNTFNGWSFESSFRKDPAR